MEVLIDSDLLFHPFRIRPTGRPGMEGVRGEEGAKRVHFWGLCRNAGGQSSFSNSRSAFAFVESRLVEPFEHSWALPPRFVLKQGRHNGSGQLRLVQRRVDR